MQWKPTTITSLTVAALSFLPLAGNADEYDVGGGHEFFEEGGGFNSGYTGPGMFRMAIGVGGAVALVIAALAIAGDETDSSSGH